MVDLPKLDQMLTALAAYVVELRRLGSVSREAFLADADKIGSSKYHFIVAIETCIGIAHHVIASEGYRFPRDNADAFSVLVEHGRLPEASEASLRAMARFRNRLVHVYWDVDDERVYEYLQDALGDLDDFHDHARGWIS